MCQISSVSERAFSHCCNFQVKFQACVIKDLQMLEVFFKSLREVSKIFSKAFNILKRMFIIAFVFKMSSFQMESLKQDESNGNPKCTTTIKFGGRSSSH
jgi:hypothetical protein